MRDPSVDDLLRNELGDALKRASACEEAMNRAQEGYETERMEHARTAFERDLAQDECVRLAAHVEHVEKLLREARAEADDLKAEKLSLYARMG